ncbi:uncharacterized protein LOC144209881 [Stigmatopora nigra]
MPLLHIPLLLLLLPPLATSCNSQRPLAELADEYRGVVRTDLNNTRGRISTWERNVSCIEETQRVQSCTTRNNTNFVATLHNLTCEMMSIRRFSTRQLVESILNSIDCTCSLELSEDHKRKKKRRTAMKQNERQKKKNNRQTQRHTSLQNFKTCKLSAILSSMTKCYEMLNSLLGDT